MRDLVDRITLHKKCTTREMLIGGGEKEYLKRIRLFKWRDVFQSLAVAILRSTAGGRTWNAEASGELNAIRTPRTC